MLSSSHFSLPNCFHLTAHTHTLQNQPCKGDSTPRQNEANIERKSWESLVRGRGRQRERERPHLRHSALKTPSWGVGGSQNPACILLTLAKNDLQRRGSHPHPLPFFFSNKGSVCSPNLLLLHTKVLPVLEMCYKISRTSRVTSPITATTTSFFTYTRLQLGFLSFVTKKVLTNRADQIPGLLQIKHHVRFSLKLPISHCFWTLPFNLQVLMLP